jgi:hypothetical protein
MSIKGIDIRDLALTSLATMAAALLVPSLPMIGVPLGALATAWMSYRYGTRTGVVAAVVATLLVTAAIALVVSPAASSSTVFTLPALLAAGPGTVWGLKRWKVTSVIAALSGAMFVAVVAGMWIQATMMSETITGQVTAETKATVETIVRLAGAQSPATAAALRTGIAGSVAQVVMLWPSSAFLSVALAAAVAVPVVSMLGRRMGVTVASLPPLADLDLSFHLAWPTIAGIALLAADAFRPGAQGWAWAAGTNLLLVVRPALFFQGLAAFAALYRRVGVGRFGRGVGFTLLVLSELVVPSVSVVGVADLFLNLRKLPRDGAGAAPGRA